MSGPDIASREYAAIAQGKGKWSRLDPTPKSGWQCVGVHDLGKSNYQTCEMCESASIRYVHHMVHPTGLRLDAGCICAGHMERTSEEVDVAAFIEAARARDSDMRNRDRRADTRRKALALNQGALRRLRANEASLIDDVVAYRWIVTELQGLRTKADELRARVEADGQDEEVIRHAEFGREVSEFLSAVEGRLAPLEEMQRQAQRRREAVRRSAHIWLELDDPIWVHKLRSTHFVTYKHRAWVYQRGQMFKAAYQLAGREEPEWGRRLYSSEEAAQSQALRAFARAMIKAGTLLPHEDPDVAAEIERLLHLRKTISDPTKRVMLEWLDE